MKKAVKLIQNTFTTTGLTLVLLTTIAKIMGGQVLFLETIYQSLFANLLIHVGLLLIGKIETPYLILDFLIQLLYFILVTTTCCYLFHWYTSTPIWVVILMTIIIDAAGCCLNAMKINQDLDFINRQLSLRRGE